MIAIALTPTQKCKVVGIALGVFCLIAGLCMMPAFSGVGGNPITYIVIGLFNGVTWSSIITGQTINRYRFEQQTAFLKGKRKQAEEELDLARNKLREILKT